VSALGVTDTSRAMLDEEAFALATLLGEAPCTNCNTVMSWRQDDAEGT